MTQVVGPRILGVARSARPRWFERYDQTASSLTLGTTPATARPGASAAWLPSACLVGRTAALRDEPIGGFDPSMRVAEDVDLVWRLAHHGAGIRYDPTVQVHHDTRATLTQWTGRKHYYSTGSAAPAGRHGNHTAPAELSPIMAAAAAALLLRHRAALPLTAAAAAWSYRTVRRTVRPVPGRETLAISLALRGLGWAVRQESALLLRHWWPPTALLATRSSKIRGPLPQHSSSTPPLPPSRTAATPTRIVLAARRLDDLAYAAGLWLGALRSGTLQALIPRRASRARPTGPMSLADPQRAR